MEMQRMEIEAMSDELVSRLGDYYWDRATDLHEAGDEAWSEAMDKAGMFIGESLKRDREYEAAELEDHDRRMRAEKPVRWFLGLV
ncbi:hypothetical protein [Rubrobacter indicoceani]|uniref:hypothetical protein n=1 Tax=Rubrobacter indicoceani TaxID=2051957 RepID=UPI0013C52F75|nr:hypothetical protein [Rubrobacter indicoceani]